MSKSFLFPKPNKYSHSFVGYGTSGFIFIMWVYEIPTEWWSQQTVFYPFLTLCHEYFFLFSPVQKIRKKKKHPQQIIVSSRAQKNAVNLSVPPSLPHLCSLLINWDFAWLNFKRPLEKTALLGCESLNLSSELWVFKSQGIIRLPNGEDEIQQCTNYVKNGKLCDLTSQLYEPFKCNLRV